MHKKASAIRLRDERRERRLKSRLDKGCHNVEKPPEVVEKSTPITESTGDRRKVIAVYAHNSRKREVKQKADPGTLALQRVHKNSECSKNRNDYPKSRYWYQGVDKCGSSSIRQ